MPTLSLYQISNIENIENYLLASKSLLQKHLSTTQHIDKIMSETRTAPIAFVKVLPIWLRQFIDTGQFSQTANKSTDFELKGRKMQHWG